MELGPTRALLRVRPSNFEPADRGSRRSKNGPDFRPRKRASFRCQMFCILHRFPNTLLCDLRKLDRFSGQKSDPFFGPKNRPAFRRRGPFAWCQNAPEGVASWCHSLRSSAFSLGVLLFQFPLMIPRRGCSYSNWLAVSSSFRALLCDCRCADCPRQRVVALAGEGSQRQQRAAALAPQRKLRSASQPHRSFTDDTSDESLATLRGRRRQQASLAGVAIALCAQG